MKGINIIIVAFALVLGINANPWANPEKDFVQFLLEIQSHVEHYHLMVEEKTRTTRVTVGQILSELNDKSVDQVTDGLRAVINIQSFTDKAINSSTGSVECVNTAARAWSQEVAAIGDKISACVNLHMEEIEDSLFDIHEFLEADTYFSFDLQNVVLEAMAKINPVTRYSELPFLVDEMGDEKWYAWIDTDTRDNLINQLKMLRQTVPTDISHCIEDAMGEFADEAAIIRGTVELC